MKALIALVIVAIVALVAFNYFTTGELRLIPASPSVETQELNRLGAQLHAVIREYKNAGRGAAVSGLDTTFEVAPIKRQVEEIEHDLRSLEKKLTRDKDREKAQRLLHETRDFLDLFR